MYTCVKLSIITFVGGLASGYLGIGGATIYNPVMLSIGKGPQDSTATGMYIVMIGACTSTLFFVGQGDFNVEYQLITGLVVCIAALCAIVLANYAIKKFGRPSLLLFLLTLVVLISTVIIPILEAKNLDSNVLARE
jgi:uncharacterized membrane protein YfcA